MKNKKNKAKPTLLPTLPSPSLAVASLFVVTSDFDYFSAGPYLEKQTAIEAKEIIENWYTEHYPNLGIEFVIASLEEFYAKKIDLARERIYDLYSGHDKVLEHKF